MRPPYLQVRGRLDAEGYHMVHNVPDNPAVRQEHLVVLVRAAQEGFQARRQPEPVDGVLVAGGGSVSARGGQAAGGCHVYLSAPSST